MNQCLFLARVLLSAQKMLQQQLVLCLGRAHIPERQTPQTPSVRRMIVRKNTIETKVDVSFQAATLIHTCHPSSGD